VADRLVRLRVRILLGAWMFLLCVVSQKKKKGKMQGNQEKETSTDEVQSKREYKRIPGRNT
jgi:hypothetical protein